jgi:hypothetical protein
MQSAGPQSVRDAANLLRAIPYRFAATVPAATTLTASKMLAADATVQALRIRIYSGAELAIQVRAWLENSVKERRNLITFLDSSTHPAGTVIKDYVDGDDDTWSFEPREPSFKEDDDTLWIEVTNTDAANAYNVAVDVLVDYAGGAMPFAAATAQAGGR